MKFLKAAAKAALVMASMAFGSSVDAQQITMRVGNVDPATAYLFGLFHDCAIPVLLKRFDNYREALKAANFASQRLFTEIEEDAVGTNHAVVGHLLARNWGLPPDVVDAILSHHDYSIFDLERDVPTAVRELVATVLIAERAIGLQQRLNDEAEWDKGSGPMAAYLGLSDSELADLVDDVGLDIPSIKDRG